MWKWYCGVFMVLASSRMEATPFEAILRARFITLKQLISKSEASYSFVDLIQQIEDCLSEKPLNLDNLEVLVNRLELQLELIKRRSVCFIANAVARLSSCS